MITNATLDGANDLTSGRDLTFANPNQINSSQHSTGAIPREESAWALFESMEDAYFVVSLAADGTMRLEEFNHTFAKIFGANRINDRGTCYDALPQDFAGRLLKALTKYAAHDQPVRFDLAIRTNLDIHRWQFLLNRVQARGAGDVRILVHGRNVTGQRQTLSDLKRMTKKLLKAQDEERRRIARELHDSTAQQLVALGICISRFEILLEAGKPSPAHASQKDLLTEMRTTLAAALKEIRTLSLLLHPPTLENLGLARALRQFVSGFARRTGIQATVTVEDGFWCRTSEAAMTMMRITQEALMNVYRHADATKVTVMLSSGRDGLALTIRDNGKGFGSHAIANTTGGIEGMGVGIAGMRARVHQLDGDLFIESRPHRGVLIRAVLPQYSQRADRTRNRLAKSPATKAG
jgi:signal transduction histidine kinase